LRFQRFLRRAKHFAMALVRVHHLSALFRDGNVRAVVHDGHDKYHWSANMWKNKRGTTVLDAVES